MLFQKGLLCKDILSWLLPTRKRYCLCLEYSVDKWLKITQYTQSNGYLLWTDKTNGVHGLQSIMTNNKGLSEHRWFKISHQKRNIRCMSIKRMKAKSFSTLITDDRVQNLKFMLTYVFMLFLRASMMVRWLSWKILSKLGYFEFLSQF